MAEFITPSMRPVDTFAAIHDLQLDADGNLLMAEGGQAVAEHVRWRLGTFEGEWFLDTQAGVPWLQELMGQRADPDLASALLKAEVLATDGVASMASFNVGFDRSTRGYQIKRMHITTTTGEGIDL